MTEQITIDLAAGTPLHHGAGAAFQPVSTQIATASMNEATLHLSDRAGLFETMMSFLQGANSI
jgi:hypothetical protein